MYHIQLEKSVLGTRATLFEKRDEAWRVVIVAEADTSRYATLIAKSYVPKGEPHPRASRKGPNG